ncbi:MAG: mechanosensitive ion channel [Candidatus Marinimicrobia bacterium]|nr:mechanosensitive ion channel [Candidatus Neomarinimicrobiota bacterium]MCF7850044.1 mechanosensitive ion channel [Candidatus Neomarinimicrobiota bacterium]
MDNFDLNNLKALYSDILTWGNTHILNWENLGQVLIILLLFTASYFLAKAVRPLINNSLKRFFDFNPRSINIFNAFLDQLGNIHFMILLWIASLILTQFGSGIAIVRLMLTLVLVWIIIKIASAVLINRFISLTISIGAWTLAALSILGVLKPMLGFLDNLGFTLGSVHLSVLSLIKAAILLLIALRLGHWLSQRLEKQLHRIPQMNPSVRVLATKTITGFIYFIIVLIVLNSIGIDFTALAVFGGALGVGIGFGLQKVISNLLSGIILLSDRSIKPGDVIQIGSVYGWISSLRGRYVSVVTRDGHEYLIPNEDLITQQVIN